MIHTDRGETQLIANRSVPGIGVLVVKHQGSLSVKPDIIHLVGEHFQRIRIAKPLTCYLVVHPHRVLLVHDVAADYHSVFINENSTVATLANRTDGALWNTMGIVGIAELIAGLLLHVISHYTLVGNGGPHILMTVDIHNVRHSLYAHATEGLLHVAFEILRLRMIDTIAC